MTKKLIFPIALIIAAIFMGAANCDVTKSPKSPTPSPTVFFGSAPAETDDCNRGGPCH